MKDKSASSVSLLLQAIFWWPGKELYQSELSKSSDYIMIVPCFAILLIFGGLLGDKFVASEDIEAGGGLGLNKPRSDAGRCEK